MTDDRSSPARVSRADLALVHGRPPAPRRRREDTSGVTLLDVWHFLGALAALEVPVPGQRNKTERLFDAGTLRAYRDSVFRGMSDEDQKEAMLVMPSTEDALRAFAQSKSGDGGNHG